MINLLHNPYGKDPNETDPGKFLGLMDERLISAPPVDLEGHVLDPESQERVMRETFAPDPKTDKIYEGFNFDAGLAPGLEWWGTRMEENNGDSNE